MFFCFFVIFRITITTEGKYKALEAQAIPKLVRLVNDDNSEVRLNAIKAITMLSEAPEGRKALLNHVEMVRNQHKMMQSREISLKSNMYHFQFSI